MQHVLHLMPSLPRVLAQVERALKICQGKRNLIYPNFTLYCDAELIFVRVVPEGKKG